MFEAKLETSTRPCRERDDLTESLADDALRASEARPLRIRRVGQQEVDAAVAQLGELSHIGLEAVDRRVVELPVARVEDEPGGRRDRKADGVGNRVRHADELDPERAEVDGSCIRIGLAQLGSPQEPVLVEFRLDEAERQPCRPDLRDTHLAQQIRQRADVVLVSVGEHDSANRSFAQVAEVRQDQVDPEVLVSRERHAGVDDDALVAELVDRHVLADLPEPAEGDHTQYVRHEGLSVGALGVHEEAEPLQAAPDLHDLVARRIDEREPVAPDVVPEQP